MKAPYITSWLDYISAYRIITIRAGRVYIN